MKNPLKATRSSGPGCVAALALCALLLPTTGGAKERVERPFQSHGDATILLDLASGVWTKTFSGVATHGGVYRDQLGTGLGPYGSGTVTVASGDQVNWSIVLTALDLDPVNGTATIEGTGMWEGGTGRFDGVSGGFHAEYRGTLEFVTETVVKLTLTFEITGTMTY